MAHVIIDRRKNGKGKSTVNKTRVVRKVRQQVKEAIAEQIKDGKVTDIVSDRSKKVKINSKGLSQPTFHHDHNGGGISDRVLPGNKEFQQGDRFKRPERGGGGGSGKGEASDSGEGDDEFTFDLTREEFLEIFFEDLELPDMVKKDIEKTDEWKWKRAGYSVDGNPSRLNIVESIKKAKGRRLALRAPKKKQLKKLLRELELLEKTIVHKKANNEDTSIDEMARDVLQTTIDKLKRKIKSVPFLDDMDLRFNRWEKFPVPTTQAVMFNIMDVSGSMGEWEKEMAKRFYMLLYLFLVRNYERVDIVYIRHHSSAKEVDEEEFFYSRETGGTLVSPALHLMKEIIDARYPINQWNIFGCQTSDGDNWGSDNAATIQAMTNLILPACQYFAYVEIDRDGGRNSDLWPHYEKLKESFGNFELSVIDDVTNIYPIFRKLFEPKT